MSMCTRVGSMDVSKSLNRIYMDADGGLEDSSMFSHFLERLIDAAVPVFCVLLCRAHSTGVEGSQYLRRP